MGADASKEQIWRYLGQYVAGADAAAWPELDRLIDNAMAYNRDFVAPTLKRRKPQGGEVAALRALDARLAALPSDAPADDIQNIVYEKGKDQAYGFTALRAWFRALNETLLGYSASSSMDSFIEV